ncbi:MAG: hypothetical protein ACP5NV_02880 [Candidatus Woesearchaeota archaeon]
MNKKAQAALEFLMTYGWAILVVLAAIGALAYFGVLSPGNLLPNKCTATPGIVCIEKPVASFDGASSYIQQTVSNGLGFTIDDAAPMTAALTLENFEPATCTSALLCALGDDDTCAAHVDLNDAARGTIVIDCGAATAGTAFKGTVVMSYTNPSSGLTEAIRIQLSGR